MNKKYIIVGIVVIAVVAIWWSLAVNKNKEEARVMSIESYVGVNINELSPVETTLGGRFYTTSIEAHGGAGTVSYEDGHNAYTADFTYSNTDTGAIKIDSFVVRK